MVFLQIQRLHEKRTVLFPSFEEDFNDRTKKQTSRILLSQTDLQRLKNEILQ